MANKYTTQAKVVPTDESEALSVCSFATDVEKYKPAGSASVDYPVLMLKNNTLRLEWSRTGDIIVKK